MKSYHKILLIGVTAILVLDTAGSLASNKLGFPYGYLAFISFFIYGAIGFKVTRLTKLQTGILFAAIVGFTDASLGWLISTCLKANTGNTIIKITPFLWAITAIVVTGMAGVAGLIGGALANVKKTQTSP